MRTTSNRLFIIFKYILIFFNLLNISGYCTVPHALILKTRKNVLTEHYVYIYIVIVLYCVCAEESNKPSNKIQNNLVISTGKPVSFLHIHHQIYHSKVLHFESKVCLQVSCDKLNRCYKVKVTLPL